MYCHKNNKLDADALPPFDETVQVLAPCQSGKGSEEQVDSNTTKPTRSGKKDVVAIIEGSTDLPPNEFHLSKRTSHQLVLPRHDSLFQQDVKVLTTNLFLCDWHPLKWQENVSWNQLLNLS